jgi:phosphoribosylformylglycinamidine synthase subunit PurL
VQNSVRELIRAGLVKSAHDCSEGGLAVALAECCFNPAGRFGAEIRFDNTASRIDQVLFNESQSRIVISIAESSVATALDLLKKSGVRALRLGTVGVDSLSIEFGGESFRWPIAELYDDWYCSIERSIAEE